MGIKKIMNKIKHLMCDLLVKKRQLKLFKKSILLTNEIWIKFDPLVSLNLRIEKKFQDLILRRICPAGENIKI